jgi:hypothetical protein
VGAAESGQARAFRIGGEARFEDDLAQFVGGSAGWTHDGFPLSDWMVGFYSQLAPPSTLGKPR